MGASAFVDDEAASQVSLDEEDDLSLHLAGVAIVLRRGLAGCASTSNPGEGL